MKHYETSKPLIIALACSSIAIVMSTCAIIMVAIRSPADTKAQPEYCGAYDRAFSKRYLVPEYPTSSPAMYQLSDILSDDDSIATDYGGVWLSEDSRIKIGLVENSGTSDNSKQTILSTVGSIGQSESVDIVPVEQSLATLYRIKDAINELSKPLDADPDSIVAVINGFLPTPHGLKVGVSMPDSPYKITSKGCSTLTSIEEKYRDAVAYKTYTKMGVFF